MSDSIDMAPRRTWIFEADVEGYYIPEKLLVIDDLEFKIIKDEKGSRYVVQFPVEAKDPDEAEKLAREKLNRVFKALTLSTGRRFDFELVGSRETTKEQIPRRVSVRFISIKRPFKKWLESEKIEQVRGETQEILRLLDKTDLHSRKAIEYFIIGTKLSEWPRESFLPFFKAIELISNKFSPEIKKRFKEKIPDLEPKEIKRLATSSRKIQYACEVLGIKGVSEKIEMIVKTRNKYDIAHATLKKDFKKETVDTCRELAREFIVNYIKKLQR